ncbi:DUF1441 family protein [Zooshikella sp. RANM57]|uniref:DUF1441 family protein n=1 Tax=Zooshikella sp. RANM57 TaxID=3425863 RepID=UPI003D6F66AD
MEEQKLLNITQIAEFYDIHRNTVMRKIRQEGIEPVDKIGNANRYNLEDVEHLFYESSARNLPPDYDPNDLPPKDRKDWYQSENERLKFELACSELIPAKEVRQESIKLMKTLVAFFESLPDKMERSRLFNSEQLDLLEKQCDLFRNQLHQTLQRQLTESCTPQQLTNS